MAEITQILNEKKIGRLDESSQEDIEDEPFEQPKLNPEMV